MQTQKIKVKRENVSSLFKQLKAKEKEIERMENEFISIVSHELKNPLTVIKGAISLVKEGDLGEVNEKQFDFLNRADENVDILNGLISKMLDIYRIESGNLVLIRSNTDISNIFDDAIKDLSLMITKKDINVIVSIDENIGPLLIDEHKIKEVAKELLSNAIRFSNIGGEVRVGGRLDGRSAVIEVIDHGDGMERDKYEKLFTKFSSTNLTKPKEGGGGLGLGLAVAKGIIEAHKGSIWAESDGPGKGSRFTFTLPRNSDKIHSKHSASNISNKVKTEF